MYMTSCNNKAIMIIIIIITLKICFYNSYIFIHFPASIMYRPTIKTETIETQSYTNVNLSTNSVKTG